MRDQSLPKISIVTPNYNQGQFLEQTIRSVLDQNYPNLEYVIVDGGSTDNSVEIIRKYEDKLHYWSSERDRGMYDAINKGFARCSGEIMAWINSDDVLWDGALAYVAAAFSSNTNVQWLQGLPSVIDEQGVVVYQRKPVFSKFFFYFRMHEHSFAFVQQESTFWSRKLWDMAGASMDLKYSIAADFDLWMRFFKFEGLYCADRQLAAFRLRHDQQSNDRRLYLREANDSVEHHRQNLRPGEKALVDAVGWLGKMCLRTRLRFIISISNKIMAIVIGKPVVL